jgi:hypothetical protein
LYELSSSSIPNFKFLIPTCLTLVVKVPNTFIIWILMNIPSLHGSKPSAQNWKPHAWNQKCHSQNTKRHAMGFEITGLKEEIILPHANGIYPMLTKSTSQWIIPWGKEYGKSMGTVHGPLVFHKYTKLQTNWRWSLRYKAFAFVALASVYKVCLPTHCLS